MQKTSTPTLCANSDHVGTWPFPHAPRHNPRTLHTAAHRSGAALCRGLALVSLIGAYRTRGTGHSATERLTLEGGGAADQTPRLFCMMREIRLWLPDWRRVAPRPAASSISADVAASPATLWPEVLGARPDS